MPNFLGQSYNLDMQVKTTKRMYSFVGALGITVGLAYLFQRHYLFGAIYTFFGAAWLLMSTKIPRSERAIQRGQTGSLAPSGPDSVADTTQKA